MDKTKPMEVVSVTDDAIDLTKTDLAKYAFDRDLSKVVEKKGQQCTRYHLRPISYKLYQRLVRTAASEELRYERAFAVSLMRVDNFEDRNGVRHDQWLPGAMLDNPALATDYPYVGDSELELFWPGVVQELGKLVFDSSFLPKRSDEGYGLPDSLRDVLIRRSRYAETQER